MRLAYGVLNLKPEEFWQLSWPEFWQLYDGFQIRRQYELEPARILAAYMINTSMGAPKTAVKPKDVFSLPEIDGERPKPKQEDLEAFRQRISQRLGREIHFQKAVEE